MKTKPCVLFIDDESFFAKTYRRELERHFEVVYCDRVADSYGFLTNQPERFAALVLDIMMPSPDFVEEARTAEGYETGLWLLTVSRQRTSNGKIHPTVILTNRDVQRVAEGLKHREIDPTDKRVIRRFKADTPARELAGYVKDVIAQAAEQDRREAVAS